VEANSAKEGHLSVEPYNTSHLLESWSAGSSARSNGYGCGRYWKWPD